MIDENMNIILIDFDRMTNKESSNTTDFTNFAPDSDFYKTSNKNDIYSIGKMIYFIINEKTPSNTEADQEDDFKKSAILKDIYKKCVNRNPNDRPSILDLIFEFIINEELFVHIAKSIKSYLWLSNDFYGADSIINAIFCFVSIKEYKRIILSCLKVEIITPTYIGYLYLSNKYVPLDINKAIYYLSFSSNKGDPEA